MFKKVDPFWFIMLYWFLFLCYMMYESVDKEPVYKKGDIVSIIDNIFTRDKLNPVKFNHCENKFKVREFENGANGYYYLDIVGCEALKDKEFGAQQRHVSDYTK